MSYKKSEILSGRIDGLEADVQRLHQAIKYIDLDKEKIDSANKKSIALLSFANDEGVRRNQGRVGAASGNKAIRQALASLPVHFDEDVIVYDAGIIIQDDNDLERHQKELAFYVEKILSYNCLPVVLGGGHDITYGNYSGIRKFLLPKKKKVGIINFDAHFDLRPIDPVVGATSGTSVWQIAKETLENKEDFSCLALGIQKYGNTKKLFDLAEKYNIEYVFGDDFAPENKSAILSKINSFIKSVDHVYLTICMDVFSASYAPGVSATSLNGIIPDSLFRTCFDQIINSGKLISIDFAEVNPNFDIDNRTSKLAASLIFRLF